VEVGTARKRKGNNDEETKFRHTIGAPMGRLDTAIGNVGFTAIIKESRNTNDDVTSAELRLLNAKSEEEKIVWRKRIAFLKRNQRGSGFDGRVVVCIDVRQLSHGRTVVKHFYFHFHFIVRRRSARKRHWLHNPGRTAIVREVVTLVGGVLVSFL
jgi:hypothetical protein